MPTLQEIQQSLDNDWQKYLASRTYTPLPPDPVPVAAPDSLQPYGTARADRLGQIQAEADQRVAAGDQYIPLLGYYNPKGTSFTDRLGQSLQFAVDAAPALMLPGVGQVDTGVQAVNVARQALDPNAAPLPTLGGVMQGTRQELSPNLRPEGSILSAIGGLTENVLGENDPIAYRGAQMLAYSRAKQAEQQQRDVERFGQTGGYLAGQGRGVAQSVGQAAMAAIPAVGQAGLIATQAAQAGGEAVDEAKRKGWSNQGALTYGTTIGAIEGVVTAKFGQWMKKLGVGVGAEGLFTNEAVTLGREATESFAKQLLKSTAGELGEEQLITTAQTVARGVMGLDDNVPEGIRTVADLRKFTAESLVPAWRDTAVQTLMSMGVGAGLQRSMGGPTKSQQQDAADEAALAKNQAYLQQTIENYNEREPQGPPRPKAADQWAESLNPRSMVEDATAPALEDYAAIARNVLNNPNALAEFQQRVQNGQVELDPTDPRLKAGLDLSRRADWQDAAKAIVKRQDALRQEQFSEQAGTIVDALQENLDQADFEAIGDIKNPSRMTFKKLLEGTDVALPQTAELRAAVVAEVKRRSTPEGWATFEDQRDKRQAAEVHASRWARMLDRTSTVEGQADELSTYARAGEVLLNGGRETIQRYQGMVDAINRTADRAAQRGGKPGGEAVFTGSEVDKAAMNLVATGQWKAYAQAAVKAKERVQQADARGDRGTIAGRLDGSGWKMTRSKRPNPVQYSPPNLPAGEFRPAGYLTQQSTPSAPEAAPSAPNLLAKAAELNPAVLTGDMLGVDELRAASGMDKATFDQQMLDLARERKISLHKSDRPLLLSQEERDQMVTDGENYFNAVSVPESQQRAMAREERLAKAAPQAATDVPRTYDDMANAAVEQGNQPAFTREQFDAAKDYGTAKLDVPPEPAQAKPSILDRMRQRQPPKEQPQGTQYASERDYTVDRPEDREPDTLDQPEQSQEGISVVDNDDGTFIVNVGSRALRSQKNDNGKWVLVDEKGQVIVGAKGRPLERGAKDTAVRLAKEILNGSSQLPSVGDLVSYATESLDANPNATIKRERRVVSINKKDRTVTTEDGDVVHVSEIGRPLKHGDWTKPVEKTPEEQEAARGWERSVTLSPDDYAARDQRATTWMQEHSADPQKAASAWYQVYRQAKDTSGEHRRSQDPAAMYWDMLEREDNFSGAMDTVLAAMRKMGLDPKEVRRQEDAAAMARLKRGMKGQQGTEKVRMTKEGKAAYKEELADVLRSAVLLSQQAAVADARMKSGGQVQGMPDRRQTETPEFQRWFAGSKVVDSQGRPLLVFHGSGTDFNVFQPSRPKDVTLLDGQEIETANSWDMGDDYRGMPEGYHYGAVTDARTLGAEKALLFRREELGKYAATSPGAARHLRDLERMVGKRLEKRTVTRPTGDGSWFTPALSYSFIHSAGTLEGGNVKPVYLSIKNPVYLNAAQIESAGRSYMMEKYIAQGYDGAIYNNGSADMQGGGWDGESQIVAFYPNQIKSATGNRGAFNPNDPNIYGMPLRPSQYTPGGVRQPVDTAGFPSSPMDYSLARAPYKLVTRLADLAKAIVGREPNMAHRYIHTGLRGQYEPATGTAAAEFGDFDGMAHEVGHFLVENGFLNTLTDNRVMDELMLEGAHLYAGRPAPAAGYMAEGFSELLRLSLGDPTAAATRMPAAAEWLRNELMAETAVAKVFKDVSKQATDWSKAEPLDRFLARQESDAKAPLKATLEARVANARLKWWSSISGLEKLSKLVDGVRKRKGLDSLPADMDPVQRARRTSGVTEAMTARFADEYAKAYDPAMHKGHATRNKFAAYLTARYALAADAANQKRAPAEQIGDTGLALPDAQGIVQKLEAEFPQFRDAAEKVYAVRQKVLDYVASQSPTLAYEVKEKLRFSVPKEFIPLQRLFPDMVDINTDRNRMFAATRDALQAKMADLMDGSYRTPADPLVGLIEDARSQIERAHLRHMMDAVINVGMQGSATFTPDLGGMVREITESLKKPNADGEMVFDANLVSKAGRDPYVQKLLVLDDGDDKPRERWFEFDGEVLDNLTSLSKHEAQFAAQTWISRTAFGKALSTLTKWSKVGMLSKPGFVLFGDPLQNAFSYFLKSEQVNPLSQFVNWARAMGELGYAGLTGKRSHAIQSMLDNTGITGSVPFAGKSDTVNRLRRMAEDAPERAARMGYRVLTDPWTRWRDFAAALQAAPMYAEAKNIMGRLGVKDFDAATEAEKTLIIAGAKEMMPHAEKGTYLAAVDQISPFMSAKLVGARSLLTAAQKRPGLVAARFSAMALAAFAFVQAMKDDEWWQSLPDELKFGGIAINTGKGNAPIFVPHNSTEAMMGLGLPMALHEAARTQDPEGVQLVMAALLGTLMPNENPIIAEIERQRTNNKSAAELSKTLLGVRQSTNARELAGKPAAEDNWDENTTKLARWVGNKLGIAPTRVDSAIDAASGGMYADIERQKELLAGERAYSGLASRDTPGLGRMFQVGTDATASLRGAKDRLFDLKAELDAVPEAAREKESPRQKNLRTTLDNTVEALNNLQALSRGAKTVAERDKWDREAAEVAEEAVSAIQAGRPVPRMARLSTRYQRLRKQAGVR